jgi:hypothetical protein
LHRLPAGVDDDIGDFAGARIALDIELAQTAPRIGRGAAKPAISVT